MITRQAVRNIDMQAGENMLEKVMELTNEYIGNMPKNERKKYGQFFTSMETARFMARLYNISENFIMRIQECT